MTKREYVNDGNVNPETTNPTQCVEIPKEVR